MLLLNTNSWNLDTFFHILLYQTELQNSKVLMGFEPTTRDFTDRMNIFAVRIYCGLHLLFYEWAQIKETNKCERPINLLWRERQALLLRLIG